MSFAARPYDLPLRIPYHWAKGTHHRRGGLLVRLGLGPTHGEAVGWGEVALEPNEPVDGPALVRAVLEPVEGLSPEHEDFLARLDARAPAPRVRAAIVTAWLSAHATAQGVPLHGLLAPGREATLDVPINGLVGAPDIPGALAQCSEYAAQGMTTLKVKCFHDVDADVARVREIRAAHPDAILRIDPNDAWKTVDDARRNLERFAPYGIQYVEDPLDATLDDLSAMAALRATSPVPVAWDRPADGMDAVQRMLDAGAVDVVVLKLPRVGGADVGLRMIDLAAAHGIPCVSTGPLETAVGTLAGLHVAALTPPPLPHCGFSLSAHLAQDVAPVPPVVRGCRRLPGGHGLGVEPEPFWRSLPE